MQNQKADMPGRNFAAGPTCLMENRALVPDVQSPVDGVDGVDGVAGCIILHRLAESRQYCHMCVSGTGCVTLA